MAPMTYFYLVVTAVEHVLSAESGFSDNSPDWGGGIQVKREM